MASLLLLCPLLIGVIVKLIFVIRSKQRIIDEYIDLYKKANWSINTLDRICRVLNENIYRMMNDPNINRITIQTFSASLIDLALRIDNHQISNDASGNLLDEIVRSMQRHIDAERKEKEELLKLKDANKILSEICKNREDDITTDTEFE